MAFKLKKAAWTVKPHLKKIKKPGGFKFGFVRGYVAKARPKKLKLRQ
jgi:hypothetical protein